MVDSKLRGKMMVRMWTVPFGAIRDPLVHNEESGISHPSQFDKLWIVHYCCTKMKAFLIRFTNSRFWIGIKKFQKIALFSFMNIVELFEGEY